MNRLYLNFHLFHINLMLIERIESFPNGKWKMTIKSNFAQNSRKLLKFVYMAVLKMKVKIGLIKVFSF